MVVAQKLYPRATVKRIVKAHSGRNVSKNADVLVRAQLNRMASLFMLRCLLYHLSGLPLQLLT